MSEEIKTLKKKIKECREERKLINKAVTMVKNQIKSERKIPIDPKEFEKRYNDAYRDLGKIQKEINNNKVKADRLKYRIDEKKLKYKNLLEPRPEKWEKLSEEIKSLGDQIVECESAISALELRKHAAEQAKESALVSLEAYKHRMHEKPIKEDPRLKAVLREKKRIVSIIEKKEAELVAIQK